MRRYEVSLEVAEAHGFPRIVVSEVEHLLEMDSANRLRARLEERLADCYRLTGADTEGLEDWRLAQEAVKVVKRLRNEHDALQDKILALVEKYSGT